MKQFLYNIEAAETAELVDQSTVGRLRVGKIGEFGGPFECFEGLGEGLLV